MSRGASDKAVVVGSYKLGAVLGKGGFGTVYSSLDEEKGGFYAIKQINLARIPKEQLNGIMQEIDLLKNLNHTNIVKYVKYIKTKDNLYIVLELVENGSLASIVKKFGKFPENLVCVYITQVLEGLVYLHEQGVVHRDIKGANILTTKEGIIKLADFGVATKFGEQNDNAVVGTPYWMAPEIIELNGSTTASDIWSVGCTVIELLTGDPPYYDLGPMPALFRIVQDDYPPLPEGISPALKDWLMQCFQKDPVLRISAQKLLKHKWIKAKRKETISQEITEKAEEAIVRHNQELEKKTEQLRKAPPKEPVNPAPPKQPVQLPPPEEDEDAWDDAFSAGSIKLDKKPTLPPKDKKLPSSPLGRTQEKPKAPNNSNNNNHTPANNKKKFVEEDDDEDWSKDLLTPTSTPTSAASPFKDLFKGTNTMDDDDDPFKDDSDNRKLSDTLKKKPASTSQKFGDKQGSKGKVANGAVTKWEDTNDDDWGDVEAINQVIQHIGSVSKGNKQASLNLGAKLLQKRTATILPNSSGLDIFEDIDEDLDDLPQFDDIAQKDVWGKMNEEILKLLGKLQLNQGENVILAAAQELITIFKENPDQKSHLIRNIGVIPIMEMLEGNNSRVIHTILQVVNQIIEDNIEIKENLCLVGGIPAIMKFSFRDYSLPIRLESANFVSQMCSTSTVTLQMFIACRGLPILVDILSTSYQESKKLVWMATDAICSVFELQSTTPKNDFCRLFSKCGLLPVLASVLRHMSEDHEAVALQLPSKVANLFLFFSTADSVVKLSMSESEVLAGLFEPLDRDRLTPDVIVKVLKGIKQLSMDHNTLINLHRAGTIRRLARVLARRDGPFITDMHNHTLNALYNLCKLDQERQYQAAQDGVVPHLMYVIESQSPLRQFALPLMCDLAHVKRARPELWKHRAVEFYLDLLSDKYWMANALDSLSSWLMDETEKVEKVVGHPSQIAKVVTAFESAEFTTFANLMEPLLHIITASLKVNQGMGTSPEFIPRLLDRLALSLPKAEVRVNLLRILTALYKCHPQPKTMIAQFKLYPVVTGLTNDKIVLVQKLASQLLVAFNSNTVV